MTIIMHFQGVPCSEQQCRGKGCTGIKQRRVWRGSTGQVHTLGNGGAERPKGNCLGGGGFASPRLEGVCWSGGGQRDPDGRGGDEVWRKERGNWPADQGATQSRWHLQAVEHSSSGWLAARWRETSHRLEKEIFCVWGLLPLPLSHDAGVQNKNLETDQKNSTLLQVVVGTAALVQVVMQGSEYSKEEKTRVAAWRLTEEGL